MAEDGVKMINGTDISASSGATSRSQSPSSNNLRKMEEGKDKPRRFQNGWSKEQERLMAEWSDIASCYRWLHDKSDKIFHTKTLWINLPVIILSTLGGTANFGIQSLFENDETMKKYASFGIGGISLFAGLLTTVGNYLRYAQLEESHRVASIAWGKFQRLVAVELALNPNDRMDSLDFLKICRADLDRLIEQSPPIPKESIILFEKKFGSIKDLRKPDICGALEHTHVFESSESRLKKVAVEAALLLRRKKQALSELVTPEMEKTITSQIETRLAEAIESRKKNLEEEIELTRQEVQRENEEREKVLEERKKKIQEEIEIEKKKLYGDFTNSVPGGIKKGTSPFESRLQTVVYNRRSSMRMELPRKEKRLTAQQLMTPYYSDIQNDNGDNIIIVNKE
jgi:hypothetical protein